METGDIIKERFNCRKCGKQSVIKIAQGWILEDSGIKEATVFIEQPRCEHCGSKQIEKAQELTLAVEKPVKVDITIEGTKLEEKATKKKK
jgi:transcription elongation factor Elf1